MDVDTVEQTRLDQLGLAARALMDAGDYERATATFAELWCRTREPKIGAALLKCLRHLERYILALPLADELNLLFPKSPVCRRQVLKAWLHGRFLRRDPNCPLEKLVACARPLQHTSLEWAWPLVCLTVMEEAVRARQWELVKTWAAKSGPAVLGKALLPERDGELSPQASWYDCLLKALRGTGRAAAALVLLDKMPEPPPLVRDRFLRHKLYAYVSLDSPHDALAICAEFGQRRPPERWALVMGARLLSGIGRTWAAMTLLCRALSYTGTASQTGTIMIDLSDLMIKIGWPGIALKQLRLVLKQYRDSRWTIPPRIYALLTAAEAACGDPGGDYAHDPNALRDCMKTWHHEAKRRIELRRDLNQTRRVWLNQCGVLRAEPGGWEVCTSNGLRSVCAQTDLPKKAESGSLVTFDAVPTFDHVHHHENTRATNIRLAP